ncbi:allantoate amidohydrolase [Pseudonocardia endophytica]|uniref:N-carbamoyl-L-amino-acid hydrolase n=1 Tax=Pseudonocardia endophytica TaxID=401976 RepID=A0A4R1HUY3_PSEEN|nr:allantoate amidohydrolase [Pseudonocardia endophytica]TCK24480.1 N-carbamoyl-L-amino-acid hydrolase [Pseudonocardia endophytica]
MTATELLSEIADVGRDPVRGGWSRHVATPAESDLTEWFVERAGRRGLDVERDGNGNTWAWWGAPGPDAVVTGSHLDSVPGGGQFDGPLGVASALSAVDTLSDRGFRPSRPFAVVVFAEEEGGRFGLPCLGSRLLTGSFDADRARALRDADGVTLAEALTTRGDDPARLGADPDRLARIGTFVELHVEQGRALEVPVGVGSTIVAHGRWRLRFTGQGNHAGTTATADRRDPMIPAAETVLAVRRAARETDARATVGRLVPRPGGTNVIASTVDLWLDVRTFTGSPEPVVDTVLAAARCAARAEGCAVESTTESLGGAVTLDEALAARMAAAIPGAPSLPTAAGHDAGILAAHVPSGMLHVRNPTGVSHAPGEHAEDDDVEEGVRALADVLEELAR